MLFDSVFNKAKWRDNDPSWPVWKDHKEEINKWLKFIESKNQLKRYKSRLNSSRPKQRDEAINEIMTAYIMETRLKYSVIHWEEKTIGKYDVDFVILNGDDNIYCEVKTLTWQSELTQKERLGDRKDLPKYIQAEGHWVDPWRNIRHALYKSIPKFLPNCMNLAILIPDLFYFPINSKKSINLDIDIALYEDSGVYNNEKGYFVNKDYENIGGILILKCKLRSFPSRIEYKYKFFANKNAKKPFSIQTKS